MQDDSFKPSQVVHAYYLSTERLLSNDILWIDACTYVERKQ